MTARKFVSLSNKDFYQEKSGSHGKRYDDFNTHLDFRSQRIEIEFSKTTWQSPYSIHFINISNENETESDGMTHTNHCMHIHLTKRNNKEVIYVLISKYNDLTLLFIHYDFFKFTIKMPVLLLRPHNLSAAQSSNNKKLLNSQISIDELE